MDLLPAVLVGYTQLRPVVQQQLTAAGVTPHHSRVEQRGQPPAVLVVGGAPKVQECLGRETRQRVVTGVPAHPEGGPHWPVPISVLLSRPRAALSLARPLSGPLPASPIPCEQGGDQEEAPRGPSHCAILPAVPEGCHRVSP